MTSFFLLHRFGLSLEPITVRVVSAAEGLKMF